MYYNVAAFLQALYTPPSDTVDKPMPAAVVDERDNIEPATDTTTRQVVCLAARPDDLPADWWLEWDERAAIMEHHGGLLKERAETLALNDILDRMRQAGIQIVRHT